MRTLLVLLACTGVACSQGSFTLEQALNAPFASSPVASPVGAKVVWLLNEQGRRNIWFAEAPGWKARKLTAFSEDDGQDIADVCWRPDGRSILFARGGDFENGGENPNPNRSLLRPDQAIWSVAVEGGVPTKLTEGHAPAVAPEGGLVAFVKGGQIFTMTSEGREVMSAIVEKGMVSGLRWSPDGKRLAFTSNRRDHSFIGVYTPASKSLRYLDASSDFDSDATWSPDGEEVAFVRQPSDPDALRGPRRSGYPWSIRVVDVAKNAGREIFRADPAAGSVFHPVIAEQQLIWSGDHIVFPWEKDGWEHLYSVGLAGGTPRLLTPGTGEVEHVRASSDRKTIWFSSNIGDIDRRHLFRLNPSGNGAAESVTQGNSIEWEPTPVGDGSAMVYLQSSVSDRAHPVVRQEGGTAKALAPETVPETYAGSFFVTPQAVSITATDGLELHGQLFLPRGPNRPHPALVFFHGGSRRQMLLGSHYMYYYSNAYGMNQYLASQGYVVLSVNYRSGIGYGLNFREALQYGATGGSEFNDVMGAGLYLKARPDVDAKRIGVWGGSYGGYLTAMALARASDLFAVGVDFHGVHDWSAFLNARVDSGDPTREQMKQESLRVAFESSPMASVSTWRSPVLLIHGDDDRNVPFAQTVMLVKALREQHVSFTELIFPNEIHDFLLNRSWLEAYKATAEYFGAHLAATSESARGSGQ